MKAKLLGLTAALLFLADAPGQAQEILLGYLPSGAGPFATLSRTNEIAAQIAIDEINEAGGIAGKKMRIIAFDTAGKPDQAVRKHAAVGNAPATRGALEAVDIAG